MKNRLVYSPSKDFKAGTYTTEALKGLVSNNKKRFPEELGEEHPFDYARVQKLTIMFGIVAAIVDKHLDFMLSGGINIKSEDERSKQVIDDFMRDNDFLNQMKAWKRQAFIKGFSPMELGEGELNSTTGVHNIDGMKLLDSDNIFVVRDDYGTVKGFNQWTRPYKDYTTQTKKEVENFTPSQIADLNYNVYGDQYYGLGIVWTLMKLIDDLIGSRKESHTLMRRKSNNPLIFLMGNKDAKNGEGDYPDSDEMGDLGSKLEVLNNKHEWVLTDYVKPMTLDFGKLSDKFEFIIENDQEALYTAAQIPAVLMGKASVAEGLAQIQMKAFQLRIQSFREDTEKVIEEKIFKRVLLANGLNTHVEVVWGLPSQEEKNEKIKMMAELLKNPLLDPNLTYQIELQIAELLDIPAEELETPEEEKKREDEEEKNPKVPEGREREPSKNPPKNGEEHIHESYSEKELEKFNNMTLQEWAGFNYQEFKDYVLSVTSIDMFNLLKGVTKTDFRAGLLNSNEIEKMRNVFYEGFDKNMTVREVTSALKKKIVFKDRLRMKDGRLIKTKSGKYMVSVPASKRAIMIARSEIIRLSNLGAIENYKTHGIEKVSWLSAMSERTCAQCDSLNGVVFDINKAPQPPLHPMCFIDGQIPIYTSKGWKKIRDIKINDLVLSHKGKFRKVTRLLNDKKYNGDVYTVEYNYSMQKNKPLTQKLTMTPEHPILTEEGFKQIKNVNENDKIMFLAKECKECGEKFPYFKIYEESEFCSLSCANKYTAKIQYEDDLQDVGKELCRILKNHNDDYKFLSLPIKHIKKWTLKKSRRLYNFAVDIDESYIVKGMVTHNCRCTTTPVTE